MATQVRRRFLGVLVASAVVATTLWSLQSMASVADDGPWTAPARAERRKNPLASDAKSIAAGKAVYVANCIKCHGDAGAGDGPSGKDLLPMPSDLTEPAIAKQSDGALYWKLTTGRSPMPAYEKLISDDERWQAVIYLRTLAAQPTHTPSK